MLTVQWWGTRAGSCRDTHPSELCHGTWQAGYCSLLSFESYTEDNSIALPTGESPWCKAN
jgi:hypothetical protein